MCADGAQLQEPPLPHVRGHARPAAAGGAAFQSFALAVHLDLSFCICPHGPAVASTGKPTTLSWEAADKRMLATAVVCAGVGCVCAQEFEEPEGEARSPVPGKRASLTLRMGAGMLPSPGLSQGTGARPVQQASHKPWLRCACWMHTQPAAADGWLPLHEG